MYIYVEGESLKIGHPNNSHSSENMKNRLISRGTLSDDEELFPNGGA